MTVAFEAFRASYASVARTTTCWGAGRGVAARGVRARPRRLGQQLSVLDLAVAHQEALVTALAGAANAADVERVAPTAAGDFYLEGLSAFEMVQRGFAEAQQTAMQGRRRTELSRQLSTFLADASLARDPHDALEEMLQLVAEQARELLDADCCVVTVADGARAASYAEDDIRWEGVLVRWLDLARR